MNVFADFAVRNPLPFFLLALFGYKLLRVLVDFVSVLRRPCAQCLIDDSREWSCLDDFAAEAMKSLLESGDRDAEGIAVRSYVMGRAMMKARAQ